MGKRKDNCPGCTSSPAEEYQKQVKAYEKYYNDYMRTYGRPPPTSQYQRS